MVIVERCYLGYLNEIYKTLLDKINNCTYNIFSEFWFIAKFTKKKETRGR